VVVSECGLVVGVVVVSVELRVAGRTRQGLAGRDRGVDKQLRVEDGDVRAMCDVLRPCAVLLQRAAHGQADLAPAVRR
jgi:hypothetical protein